MLRTRGTTEGTTRVLARNGGRGRTAAEGTTVTERTARVRSRTGGASRINLSARLPPLFPLAPASDAMRRFALNRWPDYTPP
jgi:hypothetical protein